MENFLLSPQAGAYLVRTTAADDTLHCTDAAI